VKISTIFSAFIFVATSICLAQCPVDEIAFAPGEKLNYQVSYNLGFIWLDAGEVKFRSDIILKNNLNSWYFEAEGYSYKYYDWIFRVRDKYQSIVDPQSFEPLYFRSDIDEGGYEAQNIYQFQHDPSMVFIEKTERGRINSDTLLIPVCTFDVLSAAYYARCLNFNVYKPGDKISFKLIIGGEFYELFIRYLGKEQIINRTGEKFNCIKFSAVVVEGTIFRGGEDLIVWVTDDKNKIPVMAEAKILVGSVKAYLTSSEGLK